MKNSQDEDIEEVVETSRSLLEQTPEAARRFLFHSSSYCGLDLPKYFDFAEVLACAEAIAETPSHRGDSVKIGSLTGVNHLVLDNKDGAYGWRPMQLVHPVIYAEIVCCLTDPDNWRTLRDRFAEFQSIPRIVCTSLPLVDGPVSNKATAVRSWWLGFEQKSVELSLDYKYLASTDIADCYGALYTHSIAWAVHGRTRAKSDRKSGVGNKLDSFFQDMHERQTNGIPQGNAVSDLVAEIVLGYADLQLSRKLEKRKVEGYQILRYRDDYRIFTNSKEDARKILLTLSDVLRSLNFKLSGPKTRLSEDVIGASIKSDKHYWNQSINSRKGAFKSLLLARDLGLRFPNSGSLVLALTRFREVIENLSEKPKDNSVLIAIVVDIMYHNPRVYPHAVSILSRLLCFEETGTVEDYLKRIRAKFMDIPNIGFLDIWMQRLALGYKLDVSYGESLCEVVAGSAVEVWNSDWLTEASKKAFVDGLCIVDRELLAVMEPVISVEETRLFVPRYDDDAEGGEPVNLRGSDDFFGSWERNVTW